MCIRDRLQACGDSARNVTCCPVAGVDANEVFDAYPVARDISDFFTGNREYSNLPRKFKVGVTGCREDCARIEINDIGLWPARADDGTVGFNAVSYTHLRARSSPTAGTPGRARPGGPDPGTAARARGAGAWGPTVRRHRGS